MNKFLFLLKSGIKNIYYHRKLGFTIFVSLYIMLLFNFSFLIGNNNRVLFLKFFEKKARIEIILKKDVDSELVNKFINKIKKESGKNISTIIYKNSMENLQSFLKKDALFDKLKPLLEENPIPGTITLKIKLNGATAKTIETLVAKIKKDAIVDEVIWPKSWILRIYQVNEYLKYGFWGAIALIFFITYILWLNIFKVYLFSVKTEIEIMETVGGTALYIRMPFLFESLFYAIFAYFVSYFTVFFAKEKFIAHLYPISFLSNKDILYSFVIMILITILATEKAISGFFKR